MRIQFVEHVPFEGPANIGQWAHLRGHAYQRTRLFEGDPLPSVDAFDLVVVMGGPMGVGDHEAYPWLVDEHRFVRAALNGGKALVGVCLGAQLAAAALGAEVRSNGHREIGWFPVRKTEHGKRHGLFSALPDPLTAFHWHGDTFAIPSGALHLATSDACDNQAFLWQNRVLGLQFHLDYAAENIEDMLQHCGDELDGSAHVQPAGAIRASLDLTRQTREHLFALLDRFAAMLAGGPAPGS